MRWTPRAITVSRKPRRPRKATRWLTAGAGPPVATATPPPVPPVSTGSAVVVATAVSRSRIEAHSTRWTSSATK
jgi:hypothetical protein